MDVTEIEVGKVLIENGTGVPHHVYGEATNGPEILGYLLVTQEDVVLKQPCYYSDYVYDLDELRRRFHFPRGFI